MHVTLKVFTLGENKVPLTFSLLLQLLVFVVLIMCVAVVVYSIKNRNGQNPRGIFQNLAVNEHGLRGSSSRKKNTGEKSYKFFREGYVYDVYTCQQLEDFHVKAHC